VAAHVIELRRLRRRNARRWTYARLGWRYDVHPTTVRASAVGRSWAHVVEEPPLSESEW
jgi:hypothetical protein